MPRQAKVSLRKRRTSDAAGCSRSTGRGLAVEPLELRQMLTAYSLVDLGDLPGGSSPSFECSSQKAIARWGSC